MCIRFLNKPVSQTSFFTAFSDVPVTLTKETAAHCVK